MNTPPSLLTLLLPVPMLLGRLLLLIRGCMKYFSHSWEMLLAILPDDIVLVDLKLGEYKVSVNPAAHASTNYSSL